MKFLKVSPNLFFFICLIFFILTSQMGIAQPFLGPWGVQWIGNPFYPSFTPFGGAFFQQGNIFQPFYGRGFGWGYPLMPALTPTPTILSPYQRSPHATIIFTSPTLTAVNATTPGVILIGATGVLGTPTVVIPPAPTIVAPTGAIAAALPPTVIAATNPQPAPLFSLLAVLYASGLLDGKALLSTANPLLFAYLQTLIF